MSPESSPGSQIARNLEKYGSVCLRLAPGALSEPGLDTGGHQWTVKG